MWALIKHIWKIIENLCTVEQVAQWFGWQTTVPAVVMGLVIQIKTALLGASPLETIGYALVGAFLFVFSKIAWQVSKEYRKNSQKSCIDILFELAEPYDHVEQGNREFHYVHYLRLDVENISGQPLQSCYVKLENITPAPKSFLPRKLQLARDTSPDAFPSIAHKQSFSLAPYEHELIDFVRMDETQKPYKFEIRFAKEGGIEGLSIQSKMSAREYAVHIKAFADMGKPADAWYRLHLYETCPQLEKLDETKYLALRAQLSPGTPSSSR